MKCIILAVCGLYFSLGTAPSSNGIFAAQGRVVAVQGTRDSVRMLDPDSMGDMVEVWMVHVDKWPRPEKPDFILVEYTHRDSIVKDSELDRTMWQFEIRPAPSTDSESCMNWWTKEFQPTALGVNEKLPVAKQLGCFLMKKRPVALRKLKLSSNREANDTH